MLQATQRNGVMLNSTITASIFSYSLSVSFWTSANPFLHRPFPLLPDWLHGLSDYIRFYSAQRLYW